MPNNNAQNMTRFLTDENSFEPGMAIINTSDDRKMTHR